MLQSMTGFGQSVMDIDGYHIQIAAKSVNHRYGEIIIRMPREWITVEDSIKKLFQRQVKRGRVEVFLSIERDSEDESKVEVNWSKIKGYAEAAGQISAYFQLNEKLSLKDWMALPDILVVPGDESVFRGSVGERILECAGNCVERLMEMRRTEGQYLYDDLLIRIQTLMDYHEQIKQLLPGAMEKVKGRLRKRIDDLLTSDVFHDQGFSMEIALMAERSAVDEEMVRIHSHFEQFKPLLMEKQPVGRKLDFISQEMNREVNTIGSKTTDVDISRIVIEMKTEIDKIREQVQNIQ